eukprot:11599894-Alexandrium_andersonii.AAC.1
MSMPRRTIYKQAHARVACTYACAHARAQASYFKCANTGRPRARQHVLRPTVLVQVGDAAAEGAE